MRNVFEQVNFLSEDDRLHDTIGSEVRLGATGVGAIVDCFTRPRRAVPVADVSEMTHLAMSNTDDFDVIGIDEAQFFDKTVIDFVNHMVRADKRVIIASLDTTLAGVPFEPYSGLDGDCRRGTQTLGHLH